MDNERRSHVLEVPRADPLAHAPFLKVLHQRGEAGLRFLRRHGGAFDRADGLHGGVLGGGGEAVDVLEDVGGAGDREGGSGMKRRCERQSKGKER